MEIEIALHPSYERDDPEIVHIHINLMPDRTAAIVDELELKWHHSFGMDTILTDQRLQEIDAMGQPFQRKDYGGGLTSIQVNLSELFGSEQRKKPPVDVYPWGVDFSEEVESFMDFFNEKLPTQEGLVDGYQFRIFGYAIPPRMQMLALEDDMLLDIFYFKDGNWLHLPFWSMGRHERRSAREAAKDYLKFKYDE